MKRFILFIFALVLLTPQLSYAADLKGNIVLQVAKHGEAWYVGPVTGQRYYLKDGDTAYQMLREFGLGIKNADLAKIPVGLEDRFQGGTDTDGDGLSDQLETGLGTNYKKKDSDGDGDTDKEEIIANTNPNGAGERKLDSELIEKLNGRILLQVEKNGEAWYLHPSGKRYYLADGEAAYQIMRYISLGISNKDLSKIPVGSFQGSPAPLTNGSSYKIQTVKTSNGDRTAAVLKVNWQDPKLDIMTVTANTTDCDKNCPIQSVGDFALTYDAFAAINGSYFCPADYTDCLKEKNYYYYPVYRSNDGVMINSNQIPYPSTGAMLVFGADNHPYFFTSTAQFRSVADFEANYHTKVKAAIANDPVLIQEGTNALGSVATLDPKQLKRYSRAAIGVKGNEIYLVVAYSATVPELVEMLLSLGLENALNLDAGGSTGVYYDGRYRLGPGRDVPNAILFREISS
jgi:exopolysaccharide biosynthesis protein